VLGREAGVNPVSKLLIGLGVALILAGLFWQFGAKYIPLGRLPGDIMVQKGNTRFYFPVVTCLLVSVALSLLMFLFRGRGQ
jgi:hypothetical protein